MDLRKLKTLIDLVSDSNIAELEITEADGKVRIVKSGPAPTVVAAAAPMAALAPVLFLPPSQSVPGVLLAALATLWLARLFKRRIGGYTGDCLGGVQQLAEAAFYCGMLCRFS